MSKLRGGNGSAEKVALSFRTMPGLQEFELFLGFNALGNHAPLEILAHINDGAYDWRVIGIAGDPMYERLVNFQDIHRKLLKITEAGIASPEVIHCKVKPHRFEVSKHSARGFGILHENAFGEFEVEIASIQAGIAQNRANPCDKCLGAEFG